MEFKGSIKLSGTDNPERFNVALFESGKEVESQTFERSTVTYENAIDFMKYLSTRGRLKTLITMEQQAVKKLAKELHNPAFTEARL